MPTNASPRLRERERLPGGQEARWIERGALDLLYSTAQGTPQNRLAGWLAGWAGLGWAGLGWAGLAGWRAKTCQTGWLADRAGWVGWAGLAGKFIVIFISLRN